MTKKLTSNVKFHVVIWDIYKGEEWEQEFIKPLFNNNGEILTQDLFGSSVFETINAYGCETGLGYKFVKKRISSGVLQVNIGVTPAEDYHTFGYEDGYFNFFENQKVKSKEFLELNQILNERKDEICMEGVDFYTTPEIKEVA